MSVQEQEPGPRDVCSAPPATIYPPLHGTLLTDTTPTNATSISDTHQQSMQPSNGSVQSSATEINNPRNRVNSVRHTSSVEAQLQTDGTGLATRVSEIESFTSSSSKQHASGHAKHLDANISLDASGTVDSVSSVSDSEGDTTDPLVPSHSAFSAIQDTTNADLGRKSQSTLASHALASLPTPASDSGTAINRSNSTAALAPAAFSDKTSTPAIDQPAAVSRHHAPITSSRTVSKGKRTSTNDVAIELPISKKHKRSGESASKARSASKVVGTNVAAVHDLSDDPLGMSMEADTIAASHRAGQPLEEVPPSSECTDYDCPPHVKPPKGRQSTSSSATTVSKPKSRSTTTGARSGQKAMSEDEYGHETLDMQVARDRERQDEDDDDYGRNATKGKRKSSKKNSKVSSVTRAAAPSKPNGNEPKVRKLTRADRTMTLTKDVSVRSNCASDALAPVESVQLPSGSIVDHEIDNESHGPRIEPVRLVPVVSKRKSKAVVLSSDDDNNDKQSSDVVVHDATTSASLARDNPHKLSNSTLPELSHGRKRSRARAVVSSEDEDQDDDAARDTGDDVGTRFAVVASRRIQGAAVPESVKLAGKNSIGRGRKSVDSRTQAVMRAASDPDGEDPLVADPNVNNMSDEDRVVEADDESDEDQRKGTDKENDAPPPQASKFAAQAKVLQSTVPSSSSVPKAYKKPRGLAGLLDKKGWHAHRPPGLSSRAKVPRLHVNLKPPPPPKAALPKEKVRKKKGHESYSDEEKPWYERKDPEEWDSDDHRKWNKRQNRLNKGLASDSGDDD